MESKIGYLHKHIKILISSKVISLNKALCLSGGFGNSSTDVNKTYFITTSLIVKYPWAGSVPALSNLISTEEKADKWKQNVNDLQGA